MNRFSPASNDARIRDAIEELYRLFAAPAPSMIEGCPCCIETRGVDVLLNTPLRQLSGQALWRYVSGAFLTIGSERDFRYLLPRILDISVRAPGDANDPEIVLGKLALANWRAWPADEQRAIEQLIDAWFDQALALDVMQADGYAPCQEAEGVLCGAARAGLPLAPWLARLRHPSAAPVLADLKQRFPDALSGFWGDCPAGLDELSIFVAQEPA